jgi:uncharacterized membrane protein
VFGVRIHSAVQQFSKADRGGIAIMAAGGFAIILAATAFAIDLGSLYLERRTAQGAVDLAAISAASDLPNADAAAAETIAANNIENIERMLVTRGRYTPDPAVPHTQRFQPGQTPYNAAEVSLEKRGLQYFSQLFHSGPIMMSVKGVAAKSAEATFSIGSRLASLQDGILNKVLSGLLGGNVALSAMDYNALLDANVSMFDFLNALSTELDVSAGTYSDVLGADATVGDVLDAVAAVSQQSGNDAAAAAARLLKSQSNAASLAVPLSQMIALGNTASLELGQASPGLDATFGALELVNAAAALANGEHQVSVNLAGTVPGLLSLKLDVSIGEREQKSEWVKTGEPGAVLYTAQTRLRLVAEVGGTGLLAGIRVKLPIYVAVASARAHLDDIRCNGGNIADAEVQISARPGVVDAYIGEVPNSAFTSFSAPPTVSAANIVSAPLIKATGSAHAGVGNMSDTVLTFDYDDIIEKKAKSTHSQDLAQSLVQSLVKDLQLKVNILGLPLATPAAVSSLIASLLSGVAAPLDGVLNTVLSALGIRIGEADVRVHGVRCDGSVLVN